jgi:hypothetical protein
MLYLVVDTALESRFQCDEVDPNSLKLLHTARSSVR